ncbi:siroheme decarboxylase subunit beta [Pulveribacter suum]|uniref:siroheme decarboxylase n=1 Tax=Pulveribacter suum TaxID=2116657 RepID=A0A2P1NKX8_9BURK|nr:Lrp/AsnC family transcriptional regulator [Pulveribacter suum]AVP57714.1 Lrp/AsnC family transcriptional regulator [Pulveribacter suum]
MPAQHPADMALLNTWQRGFPLCPRPFAAIGAALALGEGEVLRRYARLQQAGALSRIGAVFAPGAGGASTLAAMAVPPARLQQVAAQVSAHPGVNHNYAREHRVNLWFVATGRDAAQVEALLQAIEQNAALPVLRLPMLQPYRIDTAFDLGHGPQQARPTRAAAAALDPADWPLAALAEQGLALNERPYGDWAARLGMEVHTVLETLGRWCAQGALARFGVVVRHHELGYAANAMAVFDVPDGEADALGRALAHQRGVTLAYRRARAPGWPYSLYCMVHGRDRASVLAHVHAARRTAGLEGFAHAVLFSTQRFKQTGARRFAQHAPAAEDRHALTI